VTARIRAAGRDDAPFLSWVIQEAARSHLPRGMWDVIFPGVEHERLGYIQSLVRHEARSFCHYQGFLIAELDGRPAAALSAYVPARSGVPAFVRALQSTLEQAGWSEARMSELDPRFAPFQACAPEPPDDAWVVEWVATRPEVRGRGLVHALLERILADGRSAGHRTASVGVLIGNTPARRAYEKVGFRVLRERRDRRLEELIGAQGIAELRLDLAGDAR
jgi:translation initiation factor 4G